MGKLRNDLTGKTINGILVKKRVENRGRRVAYLCLCHCGNEFVTIGEHLADGHTKSCGCRLSKISSDRMKKLHKDGKCKFHTKHGRTNSKLYNLWCGIKRRCTNINDAAYKHYGGKGIKLCCEWYSFEPFMIWSEANGYKDGLTIDRIDGTKGYSPENCRWVDVYVQNNNTSRNHVLEYNGEKKTVAQWGRIYNIPSYRIISRLKLGWTVEQALTLPKGAKVK